MLTLPTKYKNHIIAGKPVNWIAQLYYGDSTSFIGVALKDARISDQNYLGLISSVPKISSNINLDNMSSTTGDISLDIHDIDLDKRLSEIISGGAVEFINRVLRVFSIADGETDLANAVPLFYGYISAVEISRGQVGVEGLTYVPWRDKRISLRETNGVKEPLRWGKFYEDTLNAEFLNANVKNNWALSKAPCINVDSTAVNTYVTGRNEAKTGTNSADTAYAWRWSEEGFFMRILSQDNVVGTIRVQNADANFLANCDNNVIVMHWGGTTTGTYAGLTQLDDTPNATALVQSHVTDGSSITTLTCANFIGSFNPCGVESGQTAVDGTTIGNSTGNTFTDLTNDAGATLTTDTTTKGYRDISLSLQDTEGTSVAGIAELYSNSANAPWDFWDNFTHFRGTTQQLHPLASGEDATFNTVSVPSPNCQYRFRLTPKGLGVNLDGPPNGTSTRYHETHEENWTNGYEKYTGWDASDMDAYGRPLFQKKARLGHSISMVPNAINPTGNYDEFQPYNTGFTQYYGNTWQTQLPDGYAWRFVMWDGGISNTQSCTIAAGTTISNTADTITAVLPDPVSFSGLDWANQYQFCCFKDLATGQFLEEVFLIESLAVNTINFGVGGGWNGNGEDDHRGMFGTTRINGASNTAGWQVFFGIRQDSAFIHTMWLKFPKLTIAPISPVTGEPNSNYTYRGCSVATGLKFKSVDSQDDCSPQWTHKRAVSIEFSKYLYTTGYWDSHSDTELLVAEVNDTTNAVQGDYLFNAYAGMVAPNSATYTNILETPDCMIKFSATTTQQRLFNKYKAQQSAGSGAGFDDATGFPKFGFDAECGVVWQDWYIDDPVTKLDDSVWVGGEGQAKTYTGGSGGAVKFLEVFRDILKRHCSFDIPDGQITGWTELTDIGNWFCRVYVEDDTDVYTLLQSLQYEGGFIWKMGNGDTGTLNQFARIIRLKSIYEDTDINAMIDGVGMGSNYKLSLMGMNRVISKRFISHQKHDALGSYVNVDEEFENKQTTAKYAITDGSNEESVQLNYHYDSGGTATTLLGATGDIETGFGNLYNRINGDDKVIVKTTLYDPIHQKLEDGDVIGFKNMDVTPFGYEWENLSFMITKLDRKPTSVKVECREVERRMPNLYSMWSDSSQGFQTLMHKFPHGADSGKRAYSFWTKRDGNGNFNNIRLYQSSSEWLQFYQISFGAFIVYLRNTSGGGFCYGGYQSMNTWFPVGEWKHFHIELDMSQALIGDRIKTYINGSLMSQTFGAQSGTSGFVMPGTTGNHEFQIGANSGSSVGVKSDNVVALNVNVGSVDVNKAYKKNIMGHPHPIDLHDETTLLAGWKENLAYWYKFEFQRSDGSFTDEINHLGSGQTNLSKMTSGSNNEVLVKDVVNKGGVYQ